MKIIHNHLSTLKTGKSLGSPKHFSKSKISTSLSKSQKFGHKNCFATPSFCTSKNLPGLKKLPTISFNSKKNGYSTPHSMLSSLPPNIQYSIGYRMCSTGTPKQRAIQRRLREEEAERQEQLRKEEENKQKVISLSEKKVTRIVAATIVERSPVVLPKFPQWKIDYIEMNHRMETEKLKLEELAQAKYAEKMLSKMNKSTGKKKEKKKKAGPVNEDTSSEKKGEEDEAEEKDKEKQVKPKPEYSLITSADKSGDQKSLYRALDSHLYLIVKKPRQEYAWQFPQGGWDPADGLLLRNTAQRELMEECGENLSVNYIGNAPCGFLKYKFPSDFKSEYQGAKVFLYRSQYLRGKVQVDGKEIVDYRWVTYEEMEEYFPQDTMAYLSNILFKKGEYY